MERKEIDGWPGYYIQPDGRVWNEEKQRYVAITKQPNQAETFRLNRGRGERKTFYVASMLKKYYGIGVKQKPEKKVPTREEISLEREVWMPTVYPGYWVSNKYRCWSEYSNKIVGRNYDKVPSVLFHTKNGKSVNHTLRSIVETTFGLNPPSVEGEVWRPIPKHPGFKVSSLGHVWSIRMQCFVKAHKGQRGYYTVVVDDEKFRLHRLVAKVFIPNPYKKPHVDHINENKADNSVSNLRWATLDENINYYLQNHHPNCKRLRAKRVRGRVKS